MLNFIHELPNVQLVKERHPMIVDRCTGKTVLHIGCVDSGLLEDRYSRGELLHQKLHNVCSRLYGVDIDTEGIAKLKEFGFDCLYEVDVISGEIPSELEGNDFDVIVLSEVIEHLSNPGLMLQRLASLMSPGRTELIVSVPNAFSVSNIISMANNVEFVHPDHNYYFSYVTLNNLLKKSDFEVAEQFVYIFDTDFLPVPVRSKILAYDVRDSFRPTTSLTKRLYWHLLQVGFKGFIRDIPRLVLTSYLVGRSRWWGDGLIVVCRLGLK